MSTSDCVFCKIAAGEQSADVVYEDPIAIAFLDRRPLFYGHTLLIPKDHVETFLDLPATHIDAFFNAAQRLTRAVQKAMNARGTFVAMNNTVSQSVPHLHVHIVPRNPKDGLKGFFWPRTTYRTRQEIDITCASIRAVLDPCR